MLIRIKFTLKHDMQISKCPTNVSSVSPWLDWRNSFNSDETEKGTTKLIDIIYLVAICNSY